MSKILNPVDDDILPVLCRRMSVPCVAKLPFAKQNGKYGQAVHLNRGTQGRGLEKGASAEADESFFSCNPAC